MILPLGEPKRIGNVRRRSGLFIGLFLSSLACVASLLAVVIVAWLMYPLIGVIRLISIVPTMVGFGFWNAWAEYLLMLSPDRAPKGFTPGAGEPTSGLDLLKIYDFGTVRGLLHNGVYQDAGAVHDVAVWLKARYDLATRA
jgi:hypothetical protein